jgi:DNA-binding response OmpR family regulator
MLNSPMNGQPKVNNGSRTVRFGAFEADLHSGEVRKSGSRIKIQDQPFKVLQILLEHPGVLVTREELQTRIWPNENFGDFDHAVNVAVGKLRTALGAAIALWLGWKASRWKRRPLPRLLVRRSFPPSRLLPRSLPATGS